MNSRYILAAFVAVSLPLAAQETYENANLVTPDLNGTARYVGMGGAMEALGADISTIGTNPAGIGLFRRSSANVSFGVVSQEGYNSFGDGNKTNMSFDQAGFVYSTRTGRSSFLNFAFNYSKSRNFNQILSAAGNSNGASQNAVSYNKGAAGLDLYIKNNEILCDNYQYSQIDYLYYNTILYNNKVDPENPYGFFDASKYMMDRSNTGYISEFDFNISGNLNDRVYLGLTVGIKDVNYRSYSEYSELFIDPASGNFLNSIGIGGVLLQDEREISGTGFDVKAGVIFRPVEDSPFRVGLSVATPTWYDLTTSNYTTLLIDDADANPDIYAGNGGLDMSNSYDFKLFTPWKFGVSLGHTVGNYLALGASYEYADYGSLDTRVNTDYDYYYDDYNSESDRDMNRHAKKTLQGVSTLKLGAEYKPDKNLAMRLGFNYVSPMYNKNGVKDGTIGSYGVTYQSTTDYTNWEDTYRVTAGFGYRMDKLNIDLAYQYSQTNGTFRPFYDACDNYYDYSAHNNNAADAVKVNNKRHQVLLTLGYTF
ncbi:OmpP1/FadL family transporter [Xylanibacter muris]|uniref:Hemin receptor n=1 Tax=Xylanibacter muris TaxID=2736290 RepID=A0ABX2ARP8_9BACT|nr:hemin receptor [Xylanibacter muris]NPD92707.1 hemin receptor [Xylanibacter muris]